MLRTMLKSKIHRATVTQACIDYEGSISIDENLLEAADIMRYEQVHIYNVSNGERFTTYAIPADRDSGTICLNGAAARKVSVKDLIIICTYVAMDDLDCKDHKAKNIFVDNENRIVRVG